VHGLQNFYSSPLISVAIREHVYVARVMQHNKTVVRSLGNWQENVETLALINICHCIFAVILNVIDSVTN